MEISWRHGLNDFTMVNRTPIPVYRSLLTRLQPYMINFLAQQAATIEMLKKDNEERKAREASQQKKEEDTPILGSRLMLTQGPIANTPSPGPYGRPNGVAPQPTGFGGF